MVGVSNDLEEVRYRGRVSKPCSHIVDISCTALGAHVSAFNTLPECWGASLTSASDRGTVQLLQCRRILVVVAKSSCQGPTL